MDGSLRSPFLSLTRPLMRPPDSRSSHESAERSTTPPHVCRFDSEEHPRFFLGDWSHGPLLPLARWLARFRELIITTTDGRCYDFKFQRMTCAVAASVTAE